MQYGLDGDARFEVVAARLWNLVNEGKPFTPIFATAIVLLLSIPPTLSLEYWGRAAIAFVLRAGADSEMTSGLSGADVDVIKQAPGIRREGQGPLAAAELMVIIDLPKQSSPDAPADVPVRCLETQAPQPPARHSYRFARDWTYLADALRQVMVGGVPFATLGICAAVLTGWLVVCFAIASRKFRWQ